MNSKTRKRLIELRRNTVLELTATGNTQKMIADKLGVSPSLVNEDIAFLKTQAKENISKYIDETLVYEFSKINSGLEQIVKNSWLRYDKALTDKERYMYLSLAKETYQVKAALLDSGTIIDKAIRFVNNARGLTQQNSNPLIDESTEQARTQEVEQDSNNDELTES